MPPLFGVWGQLGLDPPTFSCTILRKDGRSIKKFLFFVGFFLPCLVIICSYSCIYWTVRRQRRKIDRHLTYVNHHQAASASSGKTTVSGPTAIGAAPSKPMPMPTKTNSSNAVRCRDREDARLTTMMLLIFVCFLVSFLPLMLVNVADDGNRYPWLHIFASVMAWASSCMNPFVYAASNRTYRVAYYKLFARVRLWGRPLLAPIASSRSVGVGSNGNGNGKGGQQQQQKENQPNGAEQSSAKSPVLTAAAAKLDNRLMLNGGGAMDEHRRGDGVVQWHPHGLQKFQQQPRRVAASNFSSVLDENLLMP